MTENYAETLEKFESFLTELLENTEYPEPLAQSMRYSLFTGGKRFRPILFLEAYKAFSGKIDESALYFSSAVECLHTYSLIHDDLPCMDNDDYRRGQPTSHKKFGENIAVLTGDALLNLSYELIFKSIFSSADKDRALRAGKRFSELTGASGLIAGQIRDLDFEAKERDFSDLEYVFRHKTCDLIVAAVECGAIAGGASDGDIEAMRKFAYNFGFAFQLADDLLDGEDGDGCSILKITDKAAARKMLSDYTCCAVEDLNKVSVNTSFFAEFALRAEKRLK